MLTADLGGFKLSRDIGWSVGCTIAKTQSCSFSLRQQRELAQARDAELARERGISRRASPVNGMHPSIGREARIVPEEVPDERRQVEVGTHAQHLELEQSTEWPIGQVAYAGHEAPPELMALSSREYPLDLPRLARS